MRVPRKLTAFFFTWNLAKVLMVLGPVLALFLTCSTAKAAEFMELRKAAIEGGAYQGTNHDYLLELDRPGERLQHTTRMLMDIDIACTYFNEVCLFWNNAINAKASDSQYRSVEWDFRVGWSLGKHIELGWHHTSTHELDRKSNEFARFGLENVVFIQFKWYENPRR